MSLPAAYFDDLYGRWDDPWGFRTRWYETRKRALVLASLQSGRYGRVFEPGCSIGVTTAGLAVRADRVVAMDVASVALDRARVVLPENVDLVQGSVPGDWPDGSFDLVVISEVAYYLDRSACETLADLACGSADELVVVHWRYPVTDYPLDGDEVHEIFSAAADRRGLECLVTHLEPDIRMNTWCRDPRSPAARAGLVP